MRILARNLFVGERMPNIVLGMSLIILASAIGTCLNRMDLMAKTEQALAQQLSTNIFELSKARQDVATAKQQEEQAKFLQKQEEEAEASYYENVPLVISTLDGKGKLVGFKRLNQSNGSAQYSFIIKHEGQDITVSGTITNGGGRLSYSDDYNTQFEVRTSGEITHSKPSPSRLRLEFIVTGSQSNKYRVGDAFFAMFVIPGNGGEST